MSLRKAPAPTHLSQQTYDLFDRVYDLVMAREKAERDNRREKTMLLGGGAIMTGGCVGHIIHDMATTHSINGPLLWLTLFGAGFAYCALDIVKRNRAATRGQYDPGIIAHTLDEQIYDITHDHAQYADGAAWKYHDTPERRCGVRTHGR